jgi:hypothetical protein
MKKIVFTSCIILFLACNKQSEFKDFNIIESEQTINDKGGSTNSVPPDDGKKYTEYSCVIEDCVGTACDLTKGDCKRKACTPLPGGCLRVVLSDEMIERFAIEHATNMVREGYIEQAFFNKSKELARQILKSRQ